MQDQQEYPLLYCHGNVDFQAEALTADDRIKSAWPFLASRVKSFYKTMKPRERSNYDPEDLMAELYIVLRHRDSKWDPERGTYLTFAATIAERHLLAVRDKALTVHAPRNSASRKRNYEEEQVGSGITEKREHTLSRIKQVLNSQEAIDPAAEIEGDSLNPHYAEAMAIIKEFIKSSNEVVHAMSGIECAVIMRSFGLFGTEAQTIPEMAESLQECPEKLKRVKANAIVKIKREVKKRKSFPATTGVKSI